MSTFADSMKKYRWMEKELELWQYLIGEAAKVSEAIGPSSEEVDVEIVNHVIKRIEDEIIAPMDKKMGAIEKLEVTDAGKKRTKSAKGSGKEGAKAGVKAVKGKQGLRASIRLGKKAGPVNGRGNRK